MADIRILCTDLLVSAFITDITRRDKRNTYLAHFDFDCFPLQLSTTKCAWGCYSQGCT